MFATTGVEEPFHAITLVPARAVEIAAVTNAVVAICVVFVPAAAVGAVGVPVSAGEANFAKMDGKSM